MYIVLGIVILIYIWRIFNGSRNGLIDEVGGIREALTKLHRIIDERESHVERKN